MATYRLLIMTILEVPDAHFLSKLHFQDQHYDAFSYLILLFVDFIQLQKLRIRIVKTLAINLLTSVELISIKSSNRIQN